MTITPEIRAGIDRIRSDELAGATALVMRGIESLQAAARGGHPVGEVAAALIRAQPAMAGLRTASALARASADPPAALAILAGRVRRAPAAIARIAVPVIRLRPPTDRPLRIATCSRSDSVERTLLALAAAERLVVCCAESGPRREGALLAEALASTGIQIELYSDAGMSSAIPGSDAVVVGADALASSGFINKVGTAALAALARAHGVPVFVLAGREKILPHAEFQALQLPEGPAVPASTNPSNLQIRDPWFERVAGSTASQVVTDAGILDFADIRQASLWPRDMSANC